MVPLLLTLTLTGCVSAKYKPAPKDTPPAVKLNLEGVSPEIGVLLHSVVVFKGPGSWKQEAYWDEYIVTLVNLTDQPLSLKAAELLDLDSIAQASGGDPWDLERLSRQKLKQYDHVGRKVALGAGLGALWFGSAVVFTGTAIGGGSATVVLAGAAVTVALPVLGIGTFIRTVSARDDISAEFQRRRLSLPVELAPRESKSGSLFFPVTPGPRHLVLYYRAGEVLQAAGLPLTPLAGLHLPADPAKAPPAQSGDKPTTKPTIAP